MGNKSLSVSSISHLATRASLRSSSGRARTARHSSDALCSRLLLKISASLPSIAFYKKFWSAEKIAFHAEQTQDWSNVVGLSLLRRQRRARLSGSPPSLPPSSTCYPESSTSTPTATLHTRSAFGQPKSSTGSPSFSYRHPAWFREEKCQSFTSWEQSAIKTCFQPKKTLFGTGRWCQTTSTISHGCSKYPHERGSRCSRASSRRN